MNKEEFCIMPIDDNYSTIRYGLLERHECFYGVRNRQKSIDDGLIVFLTNEAHRGSYGVHGKNGHSLDLYLKKLAQQTWQTYYNKTTDEFIKRYGRNYL